MKGANVVYLELLLEAITENQVIEWAAELLTSIDPLSNDSAVISLAGLRGVNIADWTVKPETYLKQIVTLYYADFKVPSVETEIYAKMILREKSAGVFLNKLPHEELFSTVIKIHRLFENPVWLGELYNYACKSSNYTNSENFNYTLITELKVRLTEL
jgi:hypothetical protein